MLSVIVPVYNSSKFLKRCIDSILNQTYNDFEIILIDDGSTDESGEICDDYSRIYSNVTVFHQPNSGQSAARNKGLEIASSEYITFVDSDDYIAPNMYAKMMNRLKDSDSDIIMCDSNRVNENGITNQNIENPATYPLSTDELWHKVFVELNNAVWNKIYRKSILGNQRFSLDLIHGEDLIFNLEYLTKCNNGIYIDAKFYNYVQRSDSITGSRFSIKKLREIDSKQRAYEIILRHYPRLINTAKRYCFRSKLNVLRSIFRADASRENSYLINDIKSDLASNIKEYWPTLFSKDKIEYLLLVYFNPIYRTLIHMK